MFDPKRFHEASEAKAAKEYLDLLIEIQSAAYNHATAYTAVIIFGAYAALFTIWNQAKAILAEATIAEVGLLMGISIMAFVAFEIFKMIVVSLQMMKTRALLASNLTPAQVLQKRANLARSQRVWMIWVTTPLWILTLFISILTGFGAAFLLLRGFVSEIMAS